jgi:hypothetical protein
MNDAGQATAQVPSDVAQQVERALQQAQAAQQEAIAAGRAAAAEGAREAARAQREAARAMREAERDAARAGREANTLQPPWAQGFPDGPPQIPDGIVVMSIAFFIMCAVIAIGFPIARAIARKMDRKAVAPASEGDTRMRLERIEHAVDAIAVEVERISEGQRYTTKVMADLRALPEPDPAEALAAPALRTRERR